MKLTHKKPQNPQAESKSGITGGIPSGDSSGGKSGDSNLAKAQKIHDLGYSQRSLSTLERLSSQELDFILREKRDPQKDELSRKTIESSKEIVKGFVSTCEALKKARVNEPLNPGIKVMVESNQSALAEYVSVGAGGKVGLILLILSSIAMIIDSAIGFEKLKRNKEPRKDNQNKGDSK
ncbi:hypothetical protein [Helicobacter mastomyrinus]|uniref:Uncharacterized protein n=2 Tax=Helicobacter TaxID=209 RepID=A0ABZ3F4U9_9HELI|nr:hypothetical protein [uncultured Helicobacter sp.]